MRIFNLNAMMEGNIVQSNVIWISVQGFIYLLASYMYPVFHK